MLPSYRLRINRTSTATSYKYRFEVVGYYCLNFYTLCFSLFGGLGATHAVRLGLSGKRLVNFLLVIIELLSLRITAEALHPKID